MNNPALYPPNSPYGYMPQQHMTPQPQSFSPAGFPNQFQGSPAPHGYPQQHPGFQPQGYPQSSTPQLPSSSQPTSAPGPSHPILGQPNNMIAQQGAPGPNMAQQAQMQNAVQARPPTQPQPAQPMSPQSQQREKARVSVLLDINTALLQEVVSLQAKGMAGSQSSATQQSPNSPTSATDNALNNSPTTDGSKGKPPSQEYQDCMRRLQANLAYLASMADAKKKTTGSLPAGPAIMIPPPHLTSVHDNYKKLNQLFPEASQSTINKAMAFASAQASKQGNAAPAG